MFTAQAIGVSNWLRRALTKPSSMQGPDGQSTWPMRDCSPTSTRYLPKNTGLHMTRIRSASDIAMHRIIELSDAAVAEHRGSILPIYGSKDNGTPDHIGTAIALDLEDQKLLLTAAHVADHNEYTSLYVGGANLTLLEMHFWSSTKPDDDRDSDHFDFAIGRLPNKTVEALAGVSFFPESNICPSSVDPVGTTFTIAGYPSSKSKKFHRARQTVHPRLYHYSDVGRTNPFLGQNPHFSEETHIFLNYNKRHSQDAQGRRVNSIQLTGLSGGPLFNIGRLSDPSVLAGLQNPKSCLAGLAIEHYKSQNTVVGTRIQTILRAVQHLL